MNAKQRRVQQREYTERVGAKLLELRLLGAPPETVRIFGHYRPAAEMTRAINHYRNKTK